MVSSMASDASANRRAISAGGLMWRSALACEKPRPGFLDARALADAGDDVGEVAPLGRVHDDVVDRDERQAQVARKGAARGEALAHAAVVDHARGEPDVVAGVCDEAVDSIFRWRLASLLIRTFLHHDERKPIAPLQKIVEIKRAHALLRAQIALREQAAQAPPGGAVARIGEDVGRSVAEHEARAGDDAKALRGGLVLAREDMGAHDARDGIAVGDPHARKAQRHRLRDDLLGVRGAAQEREIRRRRKLCVTHAHAKRPCMNQRGPLTCCAASRP